MKRFLLVICAIICSMSVYAVDPPEKITVISEEKDDKIEFIARYLERDFASMSEDEINKNVGKMMMQVIETALQKKSSVSSSVVDGKEVQSIMESNMSMKINAAIVEGVFEKTTLVIELTGEL